MASMNTISQRDLVHRINSPKRTRNTNGPPVSAFEIVIANCPVSIQQTLPAMLESFGQPAIAVHPRTPYSTIRISFSLLPMAVAALEMLSSLRPMGKPLKLCPSFTPVAPGLGIYYPSNPEILYQYPDPSPEILNNIVVAMKAVPALYTQVLHLMNKMSLPPPWSSYRTIDQPTNQSSALATTTKMALTSHRHLKNPHKRAIDSSSQALSYDDSEEESEMDDSPLQSIRRLDCKRVKFNRDELLTTPEKPPTKCINVSTQPVIIPSKKESIRQHQHSINIQIHSRTLDELTSVNISTSCLSDTILPENQMTLKDVQTQSGDPVSDKSTHSSTKIPLSELVGLPAYKNYSRGNRSCTLFIKNINYKKVSESLIMNLFSSIIPNRAENSKSIISVRLMKEGRMKGQAFIKYENPQLAEAALDSFHGYIVEGKPMIIQFGKG
ncbi:hypothetical protein BASA84_001568 [Batrachochytrium salamandrivorans]|nr:hypothetical protein BASA84_001568 [Batrachochytrium salamandrivorans]